MIIYIYENRNEVDMSSIILSSVHYMLISFSICQSSCDRRSKMRNYSDRRNVLHGDGFGQVQRLVIFLHEADH